MGILDELVGGGQRQKDYKDFVDRYEQGDPSEGYSDQEVLKRYGEVSHSVPPDQYAQAAREALGKLSPEDRAEFLKMLQQRAAARGVKLPGKVASDPTDLGKMLTDLHKKPGQLRDILGGGHPQGQARVKPDHRHAIVPTGQGRARGHRGHGGQARHAGFVSNGVRQREWSFGSLRSKPMIRSMAVAFALIVSASAQAAPLAPLHQPENMVTQVREACGAGMHMVNGQCIRTSARRNAARCAVGMRSVGGRCVK